MIRFRQRFVALMVISMALGCSQGGGGAPVAPQTDAQKADAQKSHNEMKAKMEAGKADAGKTAPPK